MSRNRIFLLLSAAGVLLFSSLLCSIPGRGEEEFQEIHETNVALEATLSSASLTGTALAENPPTETLTPSPVPPTPTPTRDPAEATLDAVLTEQASNPDFSILNPPPPVAIMTDPSGDAVICTDGNSIEDTAVDIVSLKVYDPAAMNFDHDGWLLQITMGSPANETFANDWSAALLSAVAIQGSTTYTLTLNEVHDNLVTVGVLSPANNEVVPGTEDSAFVDENGNVWFEMPRDAAYLQVSAFHLPSADLDQDQRRCDVAPDAEVYTLDLPQE